MRGTHPPAGKVRPEQKASAAAATDGARRTEHRQEPEGAADSDALSDNWLLQHNRDRAEQIGYGDSVLTTLPPSEAIPLAYVHRTDPTGVAPLLWTVFG